MKKTLPILCGVLALTVLTACGGSTESTEAAECTDLSVEIADEINFTLEAYGNGESITGGKITPVQMDGAGTMPWNALIAAQLTQAGVVGLWAYGEGGFLIPLNAEAISAMPDAAVTNQEAVNQALNSSEGQATIQCVN